MNEIAMQFPQETIERKAHLKTDILVKVPGLNFAEGWPNRAVHQLEAYNDELGELWFTNIFGGNPQ